MIWSWVYDDTMMNWIDCGMMVGWLGDDLGVILGWCLHVCYMLFIYLYIYIMYVCIYIYVYVCMYVCMSEWCWGRVCIFDGWPVAEGGLGLIETETELLDAGHMLWVLEDPQPYTICTFYILSVHFIYYLYILYNLYILYTICAFYILSEHFI